MKTSRVSCALVVLAVVAAMAGCGQNTREPASEGTPRSTTAEADRTVVAGTTAGGGRTMMIESPPERAARNPNRVPRVVGATVPEAARELRRAGYGCDVSGEANGEGSGPQRVVAQRPGAGSKGYAAEQVKLTVSRPFPAGRPPRGCEYNR